MFNNRFEFDSMSDSEIANLYPEIEDGDHQYEVMAISFDNDKEGNTRMIVTFKIWSMDGREYTKKNWFSKLFPAMIKKFFVSCGKLDLYEKGKIDGANMPEIIGARGWLSTKKKPFKNDPSRIMASITNFISPDKVPKKDEVVLEDDDIPF